MSYVPNATANTGNSATGIPAGASMSGSPNSGSEPGKPQAPVIRYKPRQVRQIQTQPDVLVPAEGELSLLYQQLFESTISAQIALERTAHTKKQIAQVLRRMRQERGWPIAYVAEMVGMAPREMMCVERGFTVPRDSTLRRLMACFGFTAPVPPILFTSRLTANQKKGDKLYGKHNR